MRCPKCHYLSFEPEPRCRNCGYDLSFEPGDVVVKQAGPVEEVLPDLELRLREAEEAAPVAAPVPTSELPLFVQGLTEAAPAEARSEEPAELGKAVEGGAPELEPEPEPDEPDVIDEPMVKLPAAPRVPLSVRRPTPAPGRVREKYQRDLLESAETPWPLLAPDPVPVAPEEELHAAHVHVERVGAGRRLEAAFVDVLFIGSINAAIVWLTLQACELPLSQIGSLPILPIAALLFLLDTLYLLMFTATNGQTVGKMAAGIRVVASSDDALDRVTLKQAILRAVLTFPSVLVLGAGFIPALMGQGLALHDRFTHTRVVRA